MLSLRQLRKFAENSIFPPEKAFERVVGNLNPSWRDKLIVVENCAVEAIPKPSIWTGTKNIYTQIIKEKKPERIFELPSLIANEKKLYLENVQAINSAIAEIRVQTYIYDKLPKIPGREWYCGISTSSMQKRGFLDITVGYWDKKAFIITHLIEAKSVGKMPSAFTNVSGSMDKKLKHIKKVTDKAELELIVIYDKWVSTDARGLKPLEEFEYTHPMFKLTCKETSQLFDWSTATLSLETHFQHSKLMAKDTATRELICTYIAKMRSNKSLDDIIIYGSGARSSDGDIVSKKKDSFDFDTSLIIMDTPTWDNIFWEIMDFLWKISFIISLIALTLGFLKVIYTCFKLIYNVIFKKKY